METAERVAGIIAALKEEYPDPVCALQYRKDYELMIAVRLSAQCTDARVNIVTEKLFKQFPTLQSFADASEEEIAEAIKTCGLFRTKARDLKACAIMLLSEYDGKVPDNMEDLLRLPGVGRKSANLILGDVFRQPGAVVVDTHCIRLSNRMGLVDNDKDPVRIEKALRAVLPPEKSNDFCHRLVLHGRAVCTARKPLCDICCCAAYCKTLNQ